MITTEHITNPLSSWCAVINPSVFTMLVGNEAVPAYYGVKNVNVLLLLPPIRVHIVTTPV